MFNQPEIDKLPLHPARPSDSPSALSGIRVVDFTHFVAGPLSTLILADFGADVIKIEPANKGEDLRNYPPHDAQIPAQGGPFLWANRNKRSVAVDLKSPDGLQIVKSLIAQADIVIENFSANVMTRLGLGYEACAALNPRLIYCSISAYGREGEFADRLGFDPVVQAESGFMSMNGYPDKPGVRAASPVMDISSGMTACNAILLALLERSRSGLGQAVEVALFDVAVTMVGFAGMQQLVSGKNGKRHGNVSPDSCPSGVFDASDRQFYINCGNDRIFARLMNDVIERPDVANMPHLIRSPERLDHRAFLFDLLEGVFVQRPWSFWRAKLRKASVPHGEVRTVGEALHSDEAIKRGLVTRIAHPVKGWIPNIGSAIKMKRTPAVTPRVAPAIGQHTFEVLHELCDIDQARFDQLEQTGAVGNSRSGHDRAPSQQQPLADVSVASLTETL